MRLKKKLTLMNPQELRDYQELWLKRIMNFQPHNIGWKFCSRRIQRIEKEIHFKDLLFAGLKKINSDKIGK